MTYGGAAGGAAAAFIALQRRKIIRAFKNNGALSAQTARRLEQLDLKENLLFRRLCRLGVVRAVDGGRYYLDEVREAQVRRQKLIALGIVFVVVAVVLAIVLTLTRS